MTGGGSDSPVVSPGRIGLDRVPTVWVPYSGPALSHRRFDVAAAPPGNIKCLLIFSSGTGYGWTETHWLPNTSSTPDLATALATVNNLASKRAPILGAGHSIVGTRVSAKVGSVIASLDGAPGGTGNPLQPATSQNDSLACQMIDFTRTRKKIIHLRGIWDSVVGNEAYLVNPPAAPSYDTLVQNYLSLLLQLGFGWNGTFAAQKIFGSVFNVTYSLEGIPTFTLALDSASALPTVLPGVNTTATYAMRLSKINHSRSILNRTWVASIAYAAGPPVVLTATAATPVATANLISPGRFAISPSALILYSAFGKRTLGERRMGKQLNLYPGRSRARPIY